MCTAVNTEDNFVWLNRTPKSIVDGIQIPDENVPATDCSRMRLVSMPQATF